MKGWDVRNPDWFWAQNELFDVFLPLIGVYGVLVYTALCRELPHRPDGRISLRELNEKSLVSKTEARRALDEMARLGMIREKRSAKTKVSSAFELLDLKAAAQVPLVLEELQRRLTHSASNQRNPCDEPSATATQEELQGRPTHSASNQRNSCDEPSATATQSVPNLKVGTDESVPPRDRLEKDPQCLRGSPPIESVPPRDSLPVRRPDLSNLSPPGTVLPCPSAQSELFLNTTTLRERENTGAREAATVAKTAALDLVGLAGLIVLAHPFALQRCWAESDVLVSDRMAAIAAARAEAARTGTTPEEAALVILENVERIAREVPRDQWRWLKPPEKFFKLRDYRMEPSDLYRNHGGPHVRTQPNPQQPFAGAQRSPAAQRGVESRANIAAALERRLRRSAVAADGRDAGPVPQPGAARGDAGHVPGGVGAAGGPLRPA